LSFSLSQKTPLLRFESDLSLATVQSTCAWLTLLQAAMDVMQAVFLLKERQPTDRMTPSTKWIGGEDEKP